MARLAKAWLFSPEAAAFFRIELFWRYKIQYGKGGLRF